MSRATNLRRAYSRAKTVEDPLLNRLGLQVGRTLAARVARRRRSWTPAPEVEPLLANLATDGYAVVPDFLSTEDFEAVVAAADAAMDSSEVPHAVHALGGNELEVTWRNDAPDEERRALDRFFLHPTVVALAAGAERVAMEPGAGRCSIQRLTAHEGEPDREAAVHSDTFHPTHKLWLYLTDVTEQDGPLVYYPGSHRLSSASLRGIYRESTGPNVGSRRIDDRELAARGIEPKVFTCKRNTLVIADTFGYHCRVQSTPGGVRSVLHVELRPDPFRPPPVVKTDTSRFAVQAS